jgi:regulator of protease activity HflC (stomatin/prohibitin superfamily)
MPSNEQLKAAIASAAGRLGVDAPDTANTNNAAMAEVLKDLKARIEENAALEVLRSELTEIATELELVDFDASALDASQVAAAIEDGRAELQRRKEAAEAEEAETRAAADKRREEQQAEAAAQAEAKAAKAAAAKPKLPEYYLNDRKSLTTKRGILSDGEEITAKDLPGGKEALDGFVDSGHVAKG